MNRRRAPVARRGSRGPGSSRRRCCLLSRSHSPPRSRPRRSKAAPAQRISDGHVDFSGIWSPDRNFIYDLHDALDKGQGAAVTAVGRERSRANGRRKTIPKRNCLPTGVPRQLRIRGGSSRPRRTCSSCLKATSTAIARSFSTDARIPTIPIRPGTATPWPLGRRHAGRGYRWLQRQVLVRLRRAPAHRAAARGRALSPARLRSSRVRHDGRGPRRLHEAVHMHGHSATSTTSS